MTRSMSLGNCESVDGERQLALNGRRLSQWSVEAGVRSVGYRERIIERRWDIAVCASGLMSAQEYEAMRCPARSKASRPMATAQISTT